MRSVDFPEANKTFGPPADLTEEQCRAIRAHVAPVAGGSIDGAHIIVVAWKPSQEELLELEAGNPVFLTCVGSLPPHFITTSFREATHTA